MRPPLPSGFPSSTREVRAALHRRALPSSAFRSDAWSGDRARSFDRLGGLLAGWGPVFAAFGLHLASRVELLPSFEGFALAASAGRDPGLGTRRETFRALPPRALETALRGWRKRPCSVGSLFQDHRAELGDGTPVTVRLRRVDLRVGGRTEPFLKEVVAGLRRSGLLEPDAADRVSTGEFLAQLEGEQDLRRQARGLRDLGRLTGDLGCLEVPKVLEELSTAEVLTFEAPKGEPVPAHGESEHVEGMIELATLWLRLALGGAPFPLDAGCLEVTSRGLAVSGPGSFGQGGFGTLSTGARKDLWEYLRAVAGAAPDLAAAVLSRRCLRARPGARMDELKIRFRQTAPFRESCWTPRGDHLAEHAFAHLIWARRCGFQLGREGEAFFRGLFSVAFHTRHGAADADPLLEGLERVSWLANLAQSRRFLDPVEAGKALEGQMMALASLPQKLDSLLNNLAGGLRP